MQFGDQRPVDHIGRVLGIDGFRPFGRQQFVERPLVFGAGLTVHPDQKGLVAERQHTFPEMLGDESGDLLNPIVGGQKGAQPHRAVEDPLRFVDVGDALGLGQVEEFLVEPVGRHGHVARRHRVPERQCRLVLDRLADRVFVEVALRVVGAEDFERAFTLRGPGDRRAGEADDRGVGDRRHHVGAEVLGDRACASSMKTQMLLRVFASLSIPSNR